MNAARPLTHTILRTGSIAAMLLTTACSAGSADAHSATPDQAGQPRSAQLASAQQPATTRSSTTMPAMRVYKDASCGCCKAWVQHMTENGFQVTAIDEPPATLDSIKTAHGITQNTASCHTAEVGDYVIEGHVPADLVQKLLREHPTDAVGLAVPGMVSGSPGMEGPNPEHYTVVELMRDGSTRPYAER